MEVVITEGKTYLFTAGDHLFATYWQEAVKLREENDWCDKKTKDKLRLNRGLRLEPFYMSFIIIGLRN
jgi:hypothetical protein